MSFNKKKHVIIDLEALAGIQDADAIITAVSAVVVDGTSWETYEQILERTQFWKLSIESQEYTRTKNTETVAWWENQSEGVKIQCFYPDLNRDITPRDMLLELNQYLRTMGVDDNSIIWSRGTAYDLPKILNMYQQEGITPAFNTWNIADTKTAFLARSGGLTNQFGLGKNPKGFQKHNALHDTALEAYKLTRYFAEVYTGGSYRKTRSEMEKKSRENSGEVLENDLYTLFSGFVVGVILKNKTEKTYTKTLSDAWKENFPENPISSIVFRNSLYKVRDSGMIKTVKCGVYSHWEVVDGT